MRKNSYKTKKNLKELWKTLKQLGMPDKRSPSTNIWLEAQNGLTFNTFTMSVVFKKLFSNLGNNLVQKLPAATKKFRIKSLADFYSNMFNSNPKRFGNF